MFRVLEELQCKKENRRTANDGVSKVSELDMLT